MRSERAAPDAPYRKRPYRIALLSLMGAAAAMLCLWRWGTDVDALVAFAFFALLTGCALIDRETRSIPNALVALIGVLGACICFAGSCGIPEAAFPHPGIAWEERLLGICATGIPPLAFAAVTNGLGGGDVKLLAAIGLMIGWRLGIAALAASIILGGCQALFLVIARGARRNDTFAFGPCICIATMAVCLLAAG